MNLYRQTVAISLLNLANVPRRLGSSLVICTGIASVVAVLITVLAMATGLTHAMASAGRADRVIVLRSGAVAEALSSLQRDALVAIEAAPGIRRNDGVRALSPEVLLGVTLPRAGDGQLTGATVRGLTPTAALVRPEIRVVEGRMFATGLHEITVGRAAHGLYANLAIGDQVSFHNGNWKVVGIFTSDGDVHESELLADANALMSAAQRSVFSAATVQLDSAETFAAFKTAVQNDPMLKVDVQRETDYYESQSKDVSKLLEMVANVVGAIMAMGALFGALNTMYSAVSARAVEIATLRAIGFSSAPLAISILVEAQLLSLLGAGVGAGIAWILFNGDEFSTGGPFGQVALRLHVGPGLILIGVLWAAVIGLIGGLFPAIHAARRPVTDALRVVA
jgi:putative ABC transport system permease protein